MEQLKSALSVVFIFLITFWVVISIPDLCAVNNSDLRSFKAYRLETCTYIEVKMSWDTYYSLSTDTIFVVPANIRGRFHFVCPQEEHAKEISDEIVSDGIKVVLIPE